MLPLSDLFFFGVLINPVCLFCEITVAQATSRSEDVCSHLTANSICDMIMLSIVVKIAFLGPYFPPIQQHCPFQLLSYHWNVSWRFQSLLCPHQLKLALDCYKSGSLHQDNLFFVVVKYYKMKLFPTVCTCFYSGICEIGVNMLMFGINFQPKTFYFQRTCKIEFRQLFRNFFC